MFGHVNPKTLNRAAPEYPQNLPPLPKPTLRLYDASLRNAGKCEMSRSEAEYPPKVHHEKIIRTSFLYGMGSDGFL